MKHLIHNIDKYISSIVYNYNEGAELDLDSKNNVILGLTGIYGNTEEVKELVECIGTLTVNDLDVGDAYYTKTDGEPSLKKFMVNEARLRQANESRGRMKNEIDRLLEVVTGAPDNDSNKRVTNIDSFSALMDRLSTERIKEYNFRNKQNKLEEAEHQANVVDVILDKVLLLFNEINYYGGYDYVSEKRTFDENKLIKDVSLVLKEFKND